jgi:hypothetical protein
MPDLVGVEPQAAPLHKNLSPPPQVASPARALSTASSRGADQLTIVGRHRSYGRLQKPIKVLLVRAFKPNDLILRPKRHYPHPTSFIY